MLFRSTAYHRDTSESLYILEGWLVANTPRDVLDRILSQLAQVQADANRELTRIQTELLKDITDQGLADKTMRYTGRRDYQIEVRCPADDAFVGMIDLIDDIFVKIEFLKFNNMMDVRSAYDKKLFVSEIGHKFSKRVIKLSHELRNRIKKAKEAERAGAAKKAAPVKGPDTGEK